MENVVIVLEHDDYRFHFDLLWQRSMTTDLRLLTNGKPIQQLTDVMELNLRNMISKDWGFSPNPDHLHDAVVYHAHKIEINPFLDRVDSHKWDGVERISTALHRHFQTEDSAYTRALSRILFIAIIRRQRHPGCKFDHFIIFMGPQGLGKSEAVRALVGEEFYSDDSLFRHPDTKGRMEAMEGVVLNEFADLAYQNRRDIDDSKSFITRRVDKARMAWGRNSEARPRSCVFVGTTNESKFLKDLTGNRRYNPVQCFTYASSPYLNIKAIEAERDQLLAEAAYFEALGEPIQLPEDLIPVAEFKQFEVTQEDMWELALVDFENKGYTTPDGKSIIDRHPVKGTNRVELRVSKTNVITIVIGRPKERQNQIDGARLDNCMRAQGWLYKNQRTFTVQERGYSKEVIEQPTTQASPKPSSELDDDDTPF